MLPNRRPRLPLMSRKPRCSRDGTVRVTLFNPDPVLFAPPRGATATHFQAHLSPPRGGEAAEGRYCTSIGGDQSWPSESRSAFTLPRKPPNG